MAKCYVVVEITGTCPSDIWHNIECVFADEAKANAHRDELQAKAKPRKQYGDPKYEVEAVEYFP